MQSDSTMKLLFVCQANAQRSPTFEKWFRENKPEYEVRSAGTHYGYPYSLATSPEKDTLEWADLIFVMDMLQHKWIFTHYPKYLYKTKIVGISDQFERESEELYNLIEYWITNIEDL